MDIPNHGITDLEWETFIEGESLEEESLKIQLHMNECSPCLEFYNAMAFVSEELWIAGADLNLNHINDRLEYLKKVMIDICGSVAAINAIKRAAEATSAKSVDRINSESWPLFIDKLISIAEVMCGATGALLIRKCGSTYASV